MLAGTPTLSHAATGSVRITISRTGFIFGGGSGTLHFQGKRYPLRVGGVSVGPFGAPRVDLVGRAYHMRTAASIHGIYSAVPADAGRPGVIRLQNWHGVVLELRGRQILINDQPLTEDYIANNLAVSDNMTATARLALPDNEYYVLGDNRLTINDSRSWGPVTGDNILGRVWFSYWPPESLGFVEHAR